MVATTATQGFDTLPFMIDPTDYLRLVLDPVRLAVLGAAAVAPVDSTPLAEKLGVQTRSVLLAIVKLRQASWMRRDASPSIRCSGSAQNFRRWRERPRL